MGLCSHQIWYSSIQAPLRTSPDKIARKMGWKICLVANYSVMGCRILKFYTLVHYITLHYIINYLQWPK